MMNTDRLFLILLCVTLLLVIPSVGHAQAPVPLIVINEIGWAGSSASTADEWIELKNTTDTAVDVSGWTLEGAATSGGALTLPAGAIIAPHETYLIANYSADNANSSLSSAPNYASTSVSLSNSAIRIVLRDISEQMIDVVGDGQSPFAGITNPPTSMQRTDTAIDGALEEAWASATESIGFDSETNEFGTPGFLTSVEQTLPTSEETEIEQNTESQPAEQINTSTITEVDVSGDAGTDTQVIFDLNLDESATIAESNQETINNNSTGEQTYDTNQNNTGGESASVENTGSVSQQSQNSSTESTAPPEINYPSGVILLSEFISDPVSGTEEWVEIVNPYNNVIDLAGWKIKDASGAKTLLPDQLLGYGQYVLIKSPKGKLNNSGDAIFLFDPSDNQIDYVAYGDKPGASVAAPKKNQSAARESAEVWEITDTPTPEAVNKITRIVEVKKTSASAVKTPVVPQTFNMTSTVDLATKETPLIQNASEINPIDYNDGEYYTRANYTSTEISEESVYTQSAPINVQAARELKAKSEVVIEGMVIAAPGVLGSQTMYVNGLQIFQYAGEFPALREGDMVEIYGEMSSNRGETRLKITTPDDIRIVENLGKPVPQSIDPDDVSEDNEGRLIKTTGIVQKRSKHLLVLERGEYGLPIIAKTSTEISFSEIKVGATVEITGIVSQSDSSYRILPRSSGDVVEIAPATEGVEHHSATGEIIAGSIDENPKAKSEKKKMNYAYTLGFITLASLATFAVRHFRKQRKDPEFIEVASSQITY